MHEIHNVNGMTTDTSSAEKARLLGEYRHTSVRYSLHPVITNPRTQKVRDEHCRNTTK